MGRYSVLNFRIPTVFNIISLELVRFRNSRYSIGSRSFSCPALSFLLSFSHTNVKVENGRRVFRPFLTVFILTSASGSILCPSNCSFSFLSPSLWIIRWPSRASSSLPTIPRPSIHRVPRSLFRCFNCFNSHCEAFECLE
jgi:hypothetical protein